MRRALFICALLISFSALALDVPPPPTQWVTDRAGILGGTEADLLNRRLSDFEQTSGAQLIVYIFPSLEQESLEDFTIRAVERWKVGQKKYDNGLVLFVFVKEQKIRIEVGYGLEGTITDAVSSRVIREQIAPSFQQQQYAAGLTAATNELMTRISKGEAPVDPLQPRGSGQGQQAEGEDVSITFVIFILFMAFFVLAPMFSGRRRGYRHRSSGCGGCWLPLMFMGGGRGITFGGGG
ncbi:MAG TPA: TPM domain-containing protein, partial [Thermoanaerobaculia bacterium]